MTEPNETVEYKPRLYFGGLASAAAVLFTHPIDLIKVVLQTQKEKSSIAAAVQKIVTENGVFSLYSGISASVMRQLTYSMSRFAVYDVGKSYIPTDSLMAKVVLAGGSGAIGACIGVPADMINVRMQNDVSLPLEKRRNYKHIFDGLLRVYRDEGFGRVFSGTTTAASRGCVMTIGQIAFYDQIKTFLLTTPYFKDNVATHLAASLSAGAIATLMCQPIDVVNTRIMSAKPGEFTGLFDAIKKTARKGPLEFFRGIVPAFARIAPQTILLFMFYEQLRLNFGIPVKKKNS